MATNSYDSIIKSAINQANNDQGPFGPDLHGSILENWIYPGLVEEREFGQQIALQQMQNQWNGAPNQMELMKKAGINANVAAAGIAGAGNAPSAGSPNSAVGAGAAGVGSAAQAAGAVNEAVNAGVNAYEKFNLTPVEREKRSAETVAALQAAGLSYWEAKAIETLLPNRQKNLQADTYLKIAEFDKTTQEYHNLIEEKNRIQADVDRIKEQERLFRKQGNLVDAEKLRVDAQTQQIDLDNWWKEQDKQFWLDHGYRHDDPLDIALRNASANGKTEAADAVGKAIETVSKSERKGFNAAEIEDGYRKAFEELKAKADVDADFAPYFAAVDANKQGLVELLKFVYDNPGDFGGIVGKFITYLSSFGTSLDVIHGRVNNAKKPISGSPNTGRW